MKKKAWIWILSAVALLSILFIPIPSGAYKDGGTRSYTALTYKIVDWNRISADGNHKATRVYWFPENLRSIDELWAYEEPIVRHSFVAKVIQIEGNGVLVEPGIGEDELRSADKIWFSTEELEDIGIKEGSYVLVSYIGGIMESYPAQIHAVSWQIATDLRQIPYTGTWLDKASVGMYDNHIFNDIIITEIYENCFFAVSVIPMPYQIKLNGTLGEDWCVGDKVICTYDNTYYDPETHHIEADMRTIEVSDFSPDPNVCYKPVIYLYPEEETQVNVKLQLDGALTCTYPAYEDGWTVTAKPDGTLLDEAGKQYNYLYWEGLTQAKWDLSAGFCVKGEDTAAFLEDALEKLGLTRREANEFIVYWLPMMQDNPYNLISFQTEVYTDAAVLQADPTPDTVIRVFMAWQRLDMPVQLPAQELTAPAREGFTFVEWGGTEVK